MKDFSITLEGTTLTYAETVAAFIRKTILMNDKNLQCCSIAGSFGLVDPDGSVKNEQMLDATTLLPGNVMVYEFCLKLNETNTTPMKRYTSMVNGESITVDNKGTADLLTITRVSDDIFQVHTEAKGTVITTEIFGDLVKADKPKVLVKNFNPLAVKIDAYFRYGVGTYQDDNSKELMEKLNIIALAFPVNCSSQCQIGFSAQADEENSVITFHYDENYLTEDEIKSCLKNVLTSVAESM